MRVTGGLYYSGWGNNTRICTRMKHTAAFLLSTAFKEKKSAGAAQRECMCGERAPQYLQNFLHFSSVLALADVTEVQMCQGDIRPCRHAQTEPFRHLSASCEHSSLLSLPSPLSPFLAHAPCAGALYLEIRSEMRSN